MSQSEPSNLSKIWFMRTALVSPANVPRGNGANISCISCCWSVDWGATHLQLPRWWSIHISGAPFQSRLMPTQCEYLSHQFVFQVHNYSYNTGTDLWLRMFKNWYVHPETCTTYSVRPGYTYKVMRPSLRGYTAPYCVLIIFCIPRSYTIFGEMFRPYWMI